MYLSFWSICYFFLTLIEGFVVHCQGLLLRHVFPIGVHSADESEISSRTCFVDLFTSNRQGISRFTWVWSVFLILNYFVPRNRQHKFSFTPSLFGRKKRHPSMIGSRAVPRGRHKSCLIWVEPTQTETNCSGSLPRMASKPEWLLTRVLVWVERKQIVCWTKHRVSPRCVSVCSVKERKCKVPIPHWLSTQISSFLQTCQRCGTVMTPVDKERVGWSVLKHFFLDGVQHQKELSKKLRNALRQATKVSLRRRRWKLFKSKRGYVKVHRNSETIFLRLLAAPCGVVVNAITHGQKDQNKEIIQSYFPAHGLIESARKFEMRAILCVWQQFWCPNPNNCVVRLAHSERYKHKSHEVQLLRSLRSWKTLKCVAGEQKPSDFLVLASAARFWKQDISSS